MGQCLGWMGLGWMGFGWIALASLLAAPASAQLATEHAVGPKSAGPRGASLYDQTDAPATVGFNSQRYAPAHSSFDNMAADDFEVPAADVEWAVSEVFVAGDYFGGSGPAQTLTLVFLKDAGGLPGSAPVGCEFFGLPVPVGGSGDFLIPLPSVCSLPAGRYWLSVQAQMDHETGGQWMWRERTLQDGAPFAWQNPGDGFLTGCTSWTTAAACGASAPDLIFALAGAQVPVALQSFEVD